MNPMSIEVYEKKLEFSFRKGKGVTRIHAKKEELMLLFYAQEV